MISSDYREEIIEFTKPRPLGLLWRTLFFIYRLISCLKRTKSALRFNLPDFKSKEMKTRQRAVALYFIDKLALRAGNEKDEDQADTVGCCSLRVEHVNLHDKYHGLYLLFGQLGSKMDIKMLLYLSSVYDKQIHSSVYAKASKNTLWNGTSPTSFCLLSLSLQASTSFYKKCTWDFTFLVKYFYSVIENSHCSTHSPSNTSLPS